MPLAKKAQELSNLAWAIAEILRGDFKQSEYGKVILPFVILRRLDCILEPSKKAILEAYKNLPEGIDDKAKDAILFKATKGNLKLYNYSPLNFEKIKGQEASDLHKNLTKYVTSFDPNVRDIFIDKFLFPEQLKRLKDSDILWNVFEKIYEIDLHSDNISNHQMGYLFEDLIRKFSEISNETAGEHFTPKEVIHLITELLLINDSNALAKSGTIRTIYDPACGTGGMLALMEEAMKEYNDKIRVELYGQEINGESFGICTSDMLVTGHDPKRIAFGNTLTDDAHRDKKFHYMLSNPPYGVKWEKYKHPIIAEHEEQGMDGRFGAGLPRISDGQLLFLQHMISKMRDDEAGSRIGIVMNGSPLSTGSAKSGESKIRRWMFENDWVEAIIALPTDIFYNTAIPTYVWIITNRKSQERHGKVQLIDASCEKFWKSLRKNLGSKRREIPEDSRHEIVKIYNEMLDSNSKLGEFSKIIDTKEFGYREIRIEHTLRQNFQISAERIEKLKNEKSFLKLTPIEQEEILQKLSGNISSKMFKNRDNFKKEIKQILKLVSFKVSSAIQKSILTAFSERDNTADICISANGCIEADEILRDNELVSLKEDWQVYFDREIKPFFPESWVDEEHRDDNGEVGIIGYEVNFNHFFYKYTPPRSPVEIGNELKTIETEITNLLRKITA